MGFLPAGYPYGQTALGGGQAATQAPNPNDPNAYLNQLMAVYNSPIGQDAQAAMQQTIAMNVKQALAAMQNEKDRIAIQKGQAAADKWYKEESLKLAQQAHALAVQTQQQNYGLAQGALTGSFNGQPTLAALNQQAQYTGLYNGTPTLQAQNQQQQYALQQAQLALSQLTQQQQHELAQGTLNLATLTQQQRNAIDQAQLGLTQAGITGELNGKPTLAALAQQQNFGLSQAGVTGTYNGAPTLAAQGQMFNQGLALGAQTGYGPGGAPTLGREQAAASTALQAAQLGASLRGPGDWAQYLQAANAVSGSPASALVASAPGGLGAMQGDPGGPMTLGSLLGQFGVMPGQGASQPAPGAGGYAEPWSYGGPSTGPQMIDGTVTGAYSQPYSGGGGGQANLAQQWAQNFGGGQQVYAGGSPNFNEQTGSYSSAPAGGMRPSPQPVQNWSADAGGGYATRGGGGETSPQRIGYVDQSAMAGYNPYSLTGAIGQAAQPWQPTSQQLGFQNDDEMNQVKGWLANPNQAASTWWTSKSTDQKKYLGGLNEFWGGSNDTFLERERNARPRQQAYNMATG